MKFFVGAWLAFFGSVVLLGCDIRVGVGAICLTMGHALFVEALRSDLSSSKRGAT